MRRVAALALGLLLCVNATSILAAGPGSEGAESRFPERLALEAKLRTILLKAGFGTPEEFDPQFSVQVEISPRAKEDSRSRREQSTRHMALVLASFSPFAQVATALEKGLSDRKLSTELRFARYQGQIYILTAVAEILYNEKTPSYRSSLYPDSVFGKWERDESGEAEKLRRDLGAKKALASEFMMRLVQFMDEPVLSLTTENMEQALWRAPLENPKSEDWPFLAAAERAAVTLMKHRSNKEFMAKARAVLADRGSPPLDRLDALESLDAAPDITAQEALARAPYRLELQSFAAAWRGTLGTGLFFVPQDDEYAKLEHGLLVQALEKAQLPVSNQDNSQPGVVLTRLALPPYAFTAPAPLYLLFPKVLGRDGSQYGLAKRLLRDGIPVFKSTILASLDGPVLFAVNPAQPEDAELLVWYAAGGAALGDALLLASHETPEALARRALSWHLLVAHMPGTSGTNDGGQGRPEVGAATVGAENDRQTQDRLLMAHVCQGAFLAELLPRLKGQAAALFLGREEAFWFAVPEKEGPVWYKAEPFRSEKGNDNALTPLVSPEPAALRLDEELADALLKAEERHRDTGMAYRFSADYEAGRVSMEEALNFYHQALPGLRDKAKAVGCARYDLPSLLGLYWINRNNKNSRDLDWIENPREGSPACPERRDTIFRTLSKAERFNQ